MPLRKNEKSGLSSSAVYMRARRKEARKKGLCLWCKGVAKKGKTLCVQHWVEAGKRLKKLYEKRKKRGLCVLCGKPRAKKSHHRRSSYCVRHFEYFQAKSWLSRRKVYLLGMAIDTTIGFYRELRSDEDKRKITAKPGQRLPEFTDTGTKACDDRKKKMAS